jgi:hypothetical protein
MSSLLVWLITILAVTNGALLSYLVVEKASIWARLCVGVVVGFVLIAWAGFLLALIVGLGKVAIAVLMLILILGLLALLRFVPQQPIRRELGAISPDLWGISYYLAWVALLVWLFSRVIQLGEDGMYTAPLNNYGDLPFHFSVITSFAFGENIPPDNPIFAGVKFTYPFLIDFLTAFLRRAGAEWPLAFFIENILLALALVGLIGLLSFQLTRHRLAARITPLLFFFNGGFGFINFFRDLSRADAGWVDFLSHLPRAYTMNEVLPSPWGDVPLRWGNIFTTLLIPQRSLLLGLPMAALITMLWWMAVGEMEGEGRRGEEETQRGVEGENLKSSCLPISLSASPRRYLLTAGVLAGLLPFAHAHGFFAVMLTSGAMALLFWSRDWMAFFIPALVLAAPQAFWLSSSGVRGKLFAFHWGWESGNAPVLLFWAVNAGAFLLLLTIALLARKFVAARSRRFYLPFLLCFVVPHVVLLAPWAWDNIKVLVYWYLVSCPMVAILLARLLTGRRVWWWVVGIVLLVTITLSGMLDVARALSPVEKALIFGRAEIELAERISQQTPPRAVILHAPLHNSVVALTGRQSVMGYAGHLWSHGIDYAQRQAEITAIYRGAPGADKLLARLNVDYVIIGPAEREQLQVKEDFFASRYPVVIEHAGYQVYRIK